MHKFLFLFLVLTAALFIGCSSQESPEKQSLTFSVLYNDDQTAPFQKDWLILEEYEKQKGVKLAVQLGDNNDYERSIIQAIESGDGPDIILKVWPDTITQFASTGNLLAFSDYEYLMPNFMTYIQENNLQSELDKLRQKNGKYYILPGYQRKIQVQQWIYREDVFTKHNLGTPQTYDELLDSLIQLKNLYPDSTPLTACWGGAHLFAMIGAGYGIPAGWAGTRYYDADEDRWQFAPATENYKAMYTFLNRCYEAGILDPAVFTQSNVEYYDKLGNGSAFATVTWITSGFASWNKKLQENGYSNDEWKALPVPESTIGIKALPPVDPFRKGLIVPSTVVNESYFEDLLSFLDWAVYSEEGRTLTTWGVEGLTYENTHNGKSFLPTVKTSKNPGGTIEINKAYGFDILFNLNENAEFEDYKKPADIVTFLERSLEADEVADISPTFVLDMQSIEALQLTNEKVVPYAATTGIKFITGEYSISQDWDTYLVELEKMGYTVLEVIWNDAWAKMKQEN
ncbi:MAG: extracellular solute-binding protein [Bacteroidetes bacterium]|nr:extracellular solute-binding protein [Bacteroidota bacterium]